MKPDLPDGVTVEVLRPAPAEAAQRRAAGWLVAAGLGPGDRVAFCLPSSAALLCAVLGALRRGIVPVLLNASLTDGERDRLVADARPAVTVTDAAHLAALDAGSPVDLAALPLARPMHYTSGTTGRSKGVWSGLWDETTAEAAFTDEADLWGFAPDDVHLVCSPLYHSVSVRFAGGTLLRGGTCMVLGRFDPSAAWSALTGGHGPVPTTTFLAPSALRRLLDHVARAEAGAGAATAPDGTVGASAGSGSHRFDSLRLLVHAGSPCPPVVKRAAMARTRPGVVWEFYGSTEGQFTACSPEEWEARPGTVGRARPGRTLAVDPDGTVWCTPPPFARFAYWDDGAKTEAAWRDGAFTVGDLGRLDADGYLTLDGRRHDLIISGGVNVYPAEVEAVLAEVAGVSDVAVYGRDDERWGQRVCAAVVPGPDGPDGPGPPRSGAKDGQDGDSTGDLVAAVTAHAAANLAGYKRPKEYVLVDALPRTATGKVQRSRLAGGLSAS